MSSRAILAGCLGAGLGLAILVAMVMPGVTTPNPISLPGSAEFPGSAELRSASEVCPYFGADLPGIAGLPSAFNNPAGDPHSSPNLTGDAKISTGKTLTHRELVDQATAGMAEGHQVSRTATGAAITCALQAMEAQVTADGLAVTSTAKDEGGGFGMALSAVGRLDGPMATAGAGRVEVSGGAARLIRPLASGAAVIEEVTTSAEGIRQDFVLQKEPGGEAGAPVLVALRLTGAGVTEITDDRVSLRLDASGRSLAWHGLAVTDATGRSLPARFVQNAGVLGIRFEDASATYPVRIDPTFSDTDWLSLGGVEGTSDYVYAMAWYQMQLCVAGTFTAVGTTAANNIALWNGSTWIALGTGMSGGFSTQVNALAVSGSDLYAGGDFTTAGGASANCIAKWNGSTWSALGSGMSGGSPTRVYAVAVSGSNIYVGGSFTTAGGITANYIAKWNGGTWSALGLGAGMNNEVDALAVSGSNLYAGGFFTTAGGIGANYIAKWDGSTWSALGAGVNNQVVSLAMASGALYVGGWFTTAGGVGANYIAKWDGSTWSALGSGLDSGACSLAVSGSDLYAGGTLTTAGGISANRIAKWNGSTWSALGTGMNSSVVYALAVSGSDLFAGGTFTTAGGIGVNYIAKWNGATWSELGTGGVQRAVFSLAVSGSDLYVGGLFTKVGGVVANRIAKWDGSTWSALGTGMDFNVSALAKLGSDLYAGGQFNTAGGTSVNRIAKWNGTTWSSVAGGMNNDVLALVVSGSDLYAGGYFTTAGGVSANYIAKWNGSTWSALGSGMGGVAPTVNALVMSGSNLYAGGKFTTAGGGSANYIAKWDGTTWSALGTGMSGGGTTKVTALAMLGSDLYAGGSFTMAGGVSVNYIAKWNGATWSALGSGISGSGNYVYSLAVLGSDLYVGGYFTTAGGTSANNIAKWDGSTWSALGSGTNAEVYALAMSGNNLYVGGAFTIAGGKVSTYCALAATKGLIAVSSTTATVAESGTTATITVTLPLVPTSDVLVTLTPSDPSEAVVNPTTLLFTAADWSPKTFTITGVDDAMADGNQASTIVLGKAFSSDLRFKDYDPDDVTVTTTDNDTAGITLGAASGAITEAGGAATMNVVLTSQPTTTPVTVAVASDNTNQGTVSPASLTFTGANWFLPQTVTITGADGDGVNNPDIGIGFNVSVTASGAAEYVMARIQAETCYPSNAPPTLTAIVDQTIAEDSVGTVVNLTGIGSGQAGENQVLTVTATSSDPTILPNPTVSYVSPAATGTLTLTPLSNQNGIVTVTVTVTDDASIGMAGNKDPAKSLVRTFTVTVSAVNDAPVLIPGIASLNAQNEDDVASPGTPLSVILGALTISDVDAGAVKGIALTAADTSLGGWEYTINNGANWFGIGAVADTTARLLANNANTRIRFVPGANQNGSASLTLRAWDQTVGVNGGTANATANGGITAFSSATATATVTITPINDAPVLSSATGNPLTPVSNLIYPGTPVASLIYGLVSDVDAGAVKGIAITGLAGAGGSGIWEYTIDNGGTWHAIVAAPTTALLLSDAGTVQVRYRPQTGENGTATLSFRAWDRTSGAEGGTGNATVNGGTTAFSTQLATSAVAVISSANNAPSLTGANNLTGVTGGQPNPGTPVASLIYGFVTDVDGDPQGIAITGSAKTAMATGKWQYSTTNGSAWIDLPAVSDASALILTDAGSVLVRYAPQSGESGTASLTFRAWDRSSGLNGETVNASVNGGFTAYSSATATGSIAVSAGTVNAAPVLSGVNDQAGVTVGQLNPGTPVASLIYAKITDVDGDPQGIAITGSAKTGVGTGKWQYSTTNGGAWIDLPAVSDASALLLSDAGSVLVRYEPQSGESGTATLTVRAWDRTSGVSGGTGNATTNGGTSAFSSATAVSSNPVSAGVVNHAPVLSGSNDLSGVTVGQPNPGTPVASLIYGKVTDVDPDPQGIAITGSAKTAMATGKWQYSITNGNVWSDLPAVSDASALLLTDAGSVLVRYAPQSGESGTATLTIRAWDRTSGTNGGTANAGVNGGNTAYSSATATSAITVTVGTINHAPVLSGVNDLTSVVGGQANPGTPVASLIYGKVTDVDADPQGVAITGSAKTAMATGKWQYSTTNGSVWSDLPAVSDASALLLTDAGSVLVRYAPQSGEGGTATLTVRAWDRTSGVNGATANVTTNGGTTAYSSATAISSITVSAGLVNHAPVLSGANALTGVTGGQPNPGTPVASLIYAKVTDVDNDPQGIAITGSAKTAMATGKWQYSTTNGGAWSDLPAVSDASALLLTDAGSVLVRYVPQSGESGTATVTIRAWDRTSGSNGGTTDTTTNGGNTAYSSATAVSSITVSAGAVNHAPVISGANNLAAVTVGQPNPGTPVASLIYGKVTDVDADPQGIAITGSAKTAIGTGKWQYSTTNGLAWSDLPAVSDASALLLTDAGSVLVRYAPNTGESGTATLTVRAWDRTSGVNGGTADTTTNGGNTAYSSATATGSITVSAGVGNNAPVLADADLVTPGVQGLAMSLIKAGSPNPGNSVASLIYGLVSDVDNNPQGIAVTGLSSTGTGTWAYTTDNGTTWTAMPAVSDANALLLTDAGTVLVRFTPTAGWDGSAAISYRAWDRSSGLNGQTANASVNGGGTAFSAATATSTASVDGIVPPVVTLTAGSVTWTEKTAAVTIDSGATVSDADSADFNGGTLTVAIGPGRPGDRLEIPAAVSVPGVVSGGADGASLVITLSGGSTPTATQTVLRSITYRNLGDNPAADPSLPEDRTVTVTVNDGTVDSLPANRTLTVQPIDDAPTIQPLILALVPGLTVTGQLVASDPEGQALTYAVVGGQTKGEPTVDAATGLLTYRNTFLDGQDDSFQVSVTAGGKTGTATVTVRVTAAGATIRGFTSVPPLRWHAGQIFSYTPTVTGLGAGVVFRLVTPPQVAQTCVSLAPTDYTFDPATGTLTITSPTVPVGDYLRFGILAEDAAHTSVYQPVLMKITTGGAG